MIGLGGELGWGTIGEEISSQVDLMVQTLDAVLGKILTAKNKAKVNYFLY